MIVAIEGIITKNEPSNAVLKTSNGVSYSIGVSLKTSTKLQKGAKVELLISQVLREDANLLYGFLDVEEKRNFDMLRKLSGIGAATAMAVCSSLSPSDFVKAVINGDANALTAVPGIGVKTARRIIAELSDAKLILADIPTYKNEAIMALESLGFKREKIISVLNDCDSDNTGDLVKQALQKLAKG